MHWNHQPRADRRTEAKHSPNTRDQGCFGGEREAGMRLRASALALACLGSLQAAHAQSAPQSEAVPPLLDAITVTATRTANSAIDLPMSISSIDRARLDEAQVNTLSSALRALPNVNYGGGPRPAAQSPAIRGLQGPRIILSVDGARRNNDGGVNTPLLLEPDFVKQVDVVRGPVSAVYGSGGLGGVMAFRTLEADDIISPGSSAGARIKFGRHGADEETSAHAIAAVRSQRADALVGATYRDFGRIRSGADIDYPNDGHLRSALLKAGFAPDQRQRLDVSYQRYFDRSVGPTNPGGNLLFPFSQELERRQTQYTAAWSFHDDGRGLLDGRVSAYRTEFALAGESRSTPPQPSTSAATRTTGLSAYNSSRADAGAWGVHRITYGMDTYRDVNRNTSAGQANTVLPDGRLRAIGAFVQDEARWGEQWLAVAALRHDDYRLTSPGNVSSSHYRLTPKVSLKYQAISWLGVFVGYGEAFRAPTMTEMFGRLDTRRALFNFRANPDLRPEIGKTREIGVSLSHDELFTAHDRFRLKATYFSENVSDLIEQQTVGTYVRQAPFSGLGLVFQRRNVARAERSGAELEASYATQRMSAELGYSTLRSRNAQTRANLYAPPDKLSLSASYRLSERWSVHYLGQFVSAQDYDATLLRRRNGYAVHDVGAAFQTDRYRFDLGVDNVFDKAYATYQQSMADTFSFEEGRSLNVSISIAL